MRLKQRLFDILHDDEVEDPVERYFNLVMLLVILLSVVSVILETEDALYAQFSAFFRTFEIITVVIFSLEYVLRIWTCTMDPRYRSPILGRLKWAITPMAIIDLVAILPFYVPSSGLDLRFLRAVRLVRLFRLLKMAHYSQSLKTLTRVLRAKKDELLVTLFASVIILVLASSIMYYVEREAQPEAFNSIPSSMWWGVATLTTIGYGDIYPKTVLGKLLGSVIAMLGIGLFALPAGIIASGFSAELQNRQKPAIICPHCGEVIEDDQERE
jgi:voltage-gated potassium channel